MEYYETAAARGSIVVGDRDDVPPDHPGRTLTAPSTPERSILPMATSIPAERHPDMERRRQRVTHDVYFGMDMAAVAPRRRPTRASTRAVRRAPAPASTRPPGGGKTYYWRVDEVNDAAEGSPWKGSVWGFTTATFLVIDNFEAYTNDSPNRLFQAWSTVWAFSEDEYFQPQSANGSGSAVGHDIWSQGTTTTPLRRHYRSRWSPVDAH